METATPTFTWDDQQEQKPQQDAGGFKWDDSPAPAQATAPVQRAQPAPVRPPDTIGPAPSAAHSVLSEIEHPLNYLDSLGHQVSRPANATMAEMAATDATNFTAGVAHTIRHPIDTAGAILSQGFGLRPIVEHVANDVSQQLGGRKLYTPAPIVPQTPEDAAYALGQTAPIAALGAGYSAFRSGLAARLGKGIPTGAPVPDAAVTPPPAPEVSAPTPDVPDQPGGPAGPGGGPAPAPTEPRPSAGSTGNPAAPQQPAGPATQPAQPGKPTITLEHEPSLLDQVAAHTEALDRARAQTEGASPADIRALRDAVEETGRRAHDAGDMATVEKAAHADIALSQLLNDAIRATNEKGATAPPAEGANLNAAAAALTGKPISDVAAGKGGFTWDDQKPGGPKPVTPDKIAAVLGTAKAPIPPQAAPAPLQPATAQATNQPQPVGAPEPATGRPILQATDNPATLQQAAEAQAPWLEQQADATVQGINGAKVDAVREKKEAADLGEKLNKEGQPAATIPDYLGGRIVVDSPAARDQVVQRIRQTMPVVKETDNFEKGSDPYGFHAHTFQVRTPDGNSAELQVVPKEQADVNDQTHGLYEKGEKARIAGDQRMHQKIAQVVRSTHDVAMQAFNARNHIARDMAAKQGTDAASVAQRNQQQAPAQIKPGDAVTYPTSGGKMRPGKVVRIDGDNAYVRDGFTTIKKPLAKLQPEGGTPVKPGTEQTSNQVAKPEVPPPSTGVTPQSGASEQGEEPTVKAGKWIGVDLDGTLAHYEGFKGPTVIGEPIAPMVDRVKGWLKEGKTVKILTARVSEDPTGETKRAIQDWTEKHIGQRLDVTDVKDAHMTALYDDRAVPVERNTGKLLAQPQPEGNQNANESRNGSESPAATAPSGERSDKDAVREPEAAGLLQREPGQDRPEGSGRIQPGEQGQGTSGAGAGSEAKPLGRPGGGEKPEEVKEHKYKFGNTQADIPADSPAGRALAALRAKIDPADLMGEGLVEDSHITVRYGIQGDDTAGIRAYLEKQEPFEAELGQTDEFPASEHSDGAVPIIVPIESVPLRRMEKKIDQHGDFAERSFPDYKPHVTVAYVKPEAAHKYVGDQTAMDKTFTVKSVSITDRDGGAEEVPLKGKAAPSFYKPKTPQVAPIAGSTPLGAKGHKPSKETQDAARAKRNAELAEHFTPGNVIHIGYWNSYDKVLEFHPGTADKQWSVEVIHTDKEGNPLPNEQPRRHSTHPEARDTIVKRGEPTPAPVEKPAPEAHNKPSEAGHEPTGRSEAGDGREAPDSGRGNRAGVAPAPQGVRETPAEREPAENAGEPDRTPVSAGSRPVRGGRTEPGPGQGSDDALDLSPAGPLVEQAEKQARQTVKRNKQWFEHPADWQVPGGQITRLDNNIAALKLLREVEKNPRKLTDEEKLTLANYVGWGALSKVFDDNYLDHSWKEDHPERQGGFSTAQKAELERWRAANKSLRELLTTDEYNEAKDSTINAHYTSPELVRFMWDAVKRMGFKSGNVFEPAMGVGNFLGMMPPEIRAKVEAIGNDKDPVTTGIAKLLYPGAAIFNKPYEDLILPNNEMDLAISNVPFFEGTVYDRNYPNLKAMLHDYFFVKSLDKVKPGGLVAFITSTGTMDRQASKVRELLADQADLVAAFRLPSSAFKANAGTDVTTDLIILRKRVPGEERGGEAWAKAIPTKVPVEGDRGTMHEVTVNEYYQTHPENMLGTPVASKKMYNSLRFSLQKPARPIEELLAEALERLPKNIMKTAARPTAPNQAETEAVFAVDESLEYAYQIDQKGNVRQKRQGKLVQAAAVVDKNGVRSSAKVDRMKAMIRLREKLNDLMYHMKTMPDDEDSNRQIAVLREDLKKQYEKFVARYGYLNSTANGLFREDPHYPRLLALEHYSKAKKIGTPADIFRKRTIYPRRALTSVSQDPAEALQQILAERGYPDVDLMAQLQGKSPKEAAEALVKAGVLFRDPITGQYATREKYLSGYVRTKLDDARAAVAQGQEEYKANVEELEKVQPEFLRITNDPETSISVRLGGTWIPVPALERFFKDTFKTSANFEYKDGAWAIPFVENHRAPEITNQWATKRANAVTLLADALNLKQTTIFDNIDKDKTVVNAEDTTAARAMQESIRKEFQRWALESKEWKEPLEKAYNYAFNNLAETEYDGSFLTFPGMNPEIKLASHQVNAVWRIIQEGRALLAHEVGAGKTFEMVAAVMEARRTGVFKKPMIAVPNHIVDQFRKEFLLLYPGANILVPSEKDFDSQNRQRIMSQIATGDYDAIILPHSQFNLMDISPERQKKTIQGEMDELDEALRAAMAEDPEFKGLSIEDAERKVEKEKGSRGKNQTVKELVKSRLKFKERLKQLSDLRADTAINFDDTGVDALFVDEAHEYKNLKYFTKMTRIAGLQQANSKRSLRLLAKLQYLQEINNGRGVVFSTGTPVQNTMAELYTMTKFVAPDVLERAGIKYFDDWAANFGSVITAMELSADGRSFKARSKFARFQNVPELMRMFRAFADVKTAADLNLPRPELEGGKPIVITVPGSEKLDEVVKDLMERAEAVRSGKVNPVDDNMLKITSEGRKAATDLRLLDQEVKDENESKINVAVDQIMREYRAGNDDKLTQMVFLDMYRAMDENENELINLYQDMKKKMVAKGVAPEEIAIIGDYKTRAKRQALFDKVNSGEVRILLGSTQKMGAGTNAQVKLKALHHIDLTWRPGDLTQREGRILRQGNTNKSVRIYNYLTERSFDAYMAQTLQSKAEFLSQILSGRTASRTVTDAAADMVMSLEEMKVAASGNPDIKKKYDLEMRLAQLQTVERAFEGQRRDAQYRVESLGTAIRRSKDAILRYEKAEATIAEAKGKEGDGFSLDIDGKKFTERKAAGEYVDAMQMPPVPFYVKVNGIRARVDPTQTRKDYDPALKDGKGGYVDSPEAQYNLDYEEKSNYYSNNRVPEYTVASALRSIEARLRAIPNQIKTELDAIKDAEEQVPKFEKLAARDEFPEQAELEKVRQDLAEVEKRLGLGNINAGSQADKEETAAEVDETKEPEPPETDEDVEDDEVEEDEEPTATEQEGKKFTEGGRSAKLPEIGNKLYSGFGDPELFKQLFPALADSIAQWASNEPTTASTQKEIMRQKAGEMDRRIAIAVHMLRRESKGWRTRSHDDSIKFWNAVEQGRLDLIDPKDRHLAEVFKQAFDSMRAQLQRLKPEILQNYIENYFPHIWERPSMARAAIRGYLTGKRPLQGKAAFLKKRTIPTMQDGLDLGFTPQSWNPVDSFLLKYAEMAQFLMGHQVLDVMKKAGTAKFVRISDKPPDGWKQLDDRIGTVYRRVTAIDEDKLDDVTQPLTWPGGKRQIPGAFSEDIEDTTHGEIALVGHYYAPTDAAKVFNNYVSKGLSGRFPIFDVVRWMNANLNALQLGVSAFHASMITGVGAVSDIALGVQQLTEGKPVDFAAKVGRGILFPISALNTVRNGYRLMKEYLHPGSYAAMSKEAAAVATAGGRLKENTLQIKPLDKAINSFANGAILKGLSAVPGALLQTFTGPIMDHYVPLMKFGIFYGLAHDILDEQGRGKITAQAAQTRLNEAWNSVDNRAGQMVYRNLFWDRATLDVLQVATRSVGWNYGTIAEAGAALSGTGKAAVDIAQGKKPRLTPAMAFAMALPLTMGMWGAAANYMRTGHAPDTWKDYFYLRNSDGTYLAPPTYMKDVFSYAHDPAGTFANKLGPLWEATSEAVRNKDFYGTEIRHKDDPMVEQMAEVSKWAAKQAIPFAFSSAGKTLERRGAQDTLASMIEEGMKHPGDVLAGQLGFTPAPAFIQNSEALNKAREYQAENAPPGTRTKEQAERTRAMRVIENMYRTRTVDTSAIREMVKSGVISERDRFHAQLESRTDPLVRAVRSLHPEQALNVYRSATAEEKKELRPVIEAKEREINNDVPRDQKEALKAAFRTALHPQPRFTGPSA